MSTTKLDLGMMCGQPPSSPDRSIRSLGQLLAVINKLDVDEDIRREMVKVAKGYPEGSLDYLYNNLNTVIAKCQNTINRRNLPPDVNRPRQEAAIAAPKKPVTAKTFAPDRDQEPAQPKPVTAKAFETFAPDQAVSAAPTEGKKKWVTVSANEIYREQQAKRAAEMAATEAARRLENRATPKTPEEIEAIIKKYDKESSIIPTADPTLDEIRHQIQFLTANHSRIAQEIDNERQSTGELPPTPIKDYEAI